MMTKTGIAFAVTLVICIAPCTMAHQGTHHEHTKSRDPLIWLWGRLPVW